MTRRSSVVACGRDLPRLYKSSFASAQTPAHISLSAEDSGSTDGSGAVFRISLLNPLDNPNPAWHFKTEYLPMDKTR